MFLEKKYLGYLCIFMAIIIMVLAGVLFFGKNDKTIPEFVKRNVILTTGIDFKTGELVAFDPTTRKEVISCDSKTNIFIPADDFKDKQDSVHYKTNSSNPTKNDCAVQIVSTGDTSSDLLLRNALASSEKIIEGKVRDKGKVKDARFVVTISALYQGSHCTTTYGPGPQRTNCIVREVQCNAIQGAGGSC